MPKSILKLDSYPDIGKDLNLGWMGGHFNLVGTNLPKGIT